MTSRRVVNALSLSRIPIALAFVLLFQQNELAFTTSVILIVVALATDILDGFFARRLAVASTDGRHWDSLGDKSLYIAIIVAFNTQQLLGPVLTWGLLVREVALYITRILYIEKLPKLEQIRPFTNWHGYFMYLLTLLGLTQMYANIRTFSLDLYSYMQLTAVMALLCGVASIVHWLRLE